MRRHRFVFALLALAPSALAAPLPDGGVTAEEVARSMREKGYSTEVSTDKDGDPLIRSTVKGLKFGVYFFECRDGTRCASIQFACGFTLKGVGPEKIAQWNRTKRFGRSYLDKTGDPWIEMDMDFEHGGTSEALANDLDRWNAVTAEFAKHVNYPTK